MVGKELAREVNETVASWAFDRRPLEHHARDFVFGRSVANAAGGIGGNAQAEGQASAQLTVVLEAPHPAQHVASPLLLCENLVVAACSNFNEGEPGGRCTPPNR